MTQSSPEVHQLIDDTLIRAAGGIVAKCTCGWVSRPYFSGMSASLTFREHQAGERPVKRIPIAAAQRIAEQYGYDQVIIYARKVGDPGGEHMTTYGVTRSHCAAASRIANFLQTKIMGWVKEQPK